MKILIKLLCLFCFGVLNNTSNAQNNNVNKASFQSCEIISEPLINYIKDKFIPLILNPKNKDKLASSCLEVVIYKKKDNTYKIYLNCRTVPKRDILEGRYWSIERFKYRYYTEVDGMTFEVYSQIPAPNNFVKVNSGQNKFFEFKKPKILFPTIDDRSYFVIFNFEGNELINYEVGNPIRLEEN